MMETKETNQSGAMKTLLVVTAAFGGAFVGTLATHALAPAPALKASYVAAEKMQPAFEMTTEKLAVPAEKLAVPAEKLAVPAEKLVNGQDWNTVSFSSNSRPGTAKKDPDAPKGGGGTEISLAIQEGRTAKGLTQKQLAQQLNMKPQVINEYEAGKGIPIQAVIAKIERVLGVKIPRAKK